MIFGRRRKRERDVEPEPQSESVEEQDEAPEPVATVDGEPDWAELDAREWRDQGPFDIDEVHLDGDEVHRLDLGAIVITPIKGSQLRMQIDEKTQKVVSVLVMEKESALELMLFAAPRSGGLWTEVRDQIVAEAKRLGGRAGLAVGPFGTEVRRVMPAKTPDGQQAVQPSRLFAAEGPRWMLRGMLVGAAAMASGEDGASAELFNLFRDVVVRRGDDPMAPGEMIGMRLPESLTPKG